MRLAFILGAALTALAMPLTAQARIGIDAEIGPEFTLSSDAPQADEEPLILLGIDGGLRVTPNFRLGVASAFDLSSSVDRREFLGTAQAMLDLWLIEPYAGFGVGWASREVPGQDGGTVTDDGVMFMGQAGARVCFLGPLILDGTLTLGWVRNHIGSDSWAQVTRVGVGLGVKI